MYKNRILKVKNILLKSEQKEMLKKRMFAKSTWYYWFINYISELIRKRLVVLKTNLLVFLKQTQPRVTVNQNVSLMCMQVERNQGNQKEKNNPKVTS